MTDLSQVWVLKYAPKDINDMLLSEENKTIFSALKDIPNNFLFCGKTGCGKTTLAKMLAEKFAPHSHMYLNASDENGIDTIRNKIHDFVSVASFDGGMKLVILDEADGLTHPAQMALRGIMEEFLDSVRFILTANYEHKLTEAMKSRCKFFSFGVDIKDVRKRMVEIIKAEGITGVVEDKDNFFKLIKKFFPDVRKTINELQICCLTGKFIYAEGLQSEVPEKVYAMIKAKTDPFAIRKYLIENADDFGNDYHQVMRNIFDYYVKDGNMKALLQVSEYMYRDAFVLDKEVNASALIFNLTNL